MLNRMRDLVKRLELPQEPDEQDVVYRIIDEEQNAVEVTAAQYTRWRLLNDVSQLAIVGRDVIRDVRVYTTFSIMPEDRGYKPFGTSAVNLSTLEPLSMYGQRYDTWQQAEVGHRQVVERIRRDFAAVSGTAPDDPAPSFVVLAVSQSLDEALASAFQVRAASDSLATISTPLLMSDGSHIDVDVAQVDDGFALSFPSEGSELSWEDLAERLDSGRSADLCRLFGVTASPNGLSCSAAAPEQLGVAVVNLAQAVATASFALPKSDDNP